VKRWQRILIRMLIAAQLVAGAPLAGASPVASAAQPMDCADMMGMAAGAQAAPANAGDCPCCPSDTSMAACLSACVAALGITPSLPSSFPPAETLRAQRPVILASSRATDPPSKPPPIA
jgi:hypothetical protein